MTKLTNDSIDKTIFTSISRDDEPDNTSFIDFVALGLEGFANVVFEDKNIPEDKFYTDYAGAGARDLLSTGEALYGIMVNDDKYKFADANVNAIGKDVFDDYMMLANTTDSDGPDKSADRPDTISYEEMKYFVSALLPKEAVGTGIIHAVAKNLRGKSVDDIEDIFEKNSSNLTDKSEISRSEVLAYGLIDSSVANTLLNKDGKAVDEGGKVDLEWVTDLKKANLAKFLGIKDSELKQGAFSKIKQNLTFVTIPWLDKNGKPSSSGEEVPATRANQHQYLIALLESIDKYNAGKAEGNKVKFNFMTTDTTPKKRKMEYGVDGTSAT